MSDLLTKELLWAVPGWRLILAIFIIFLGFASRRVIHSSLKAYLVRQAKKTTAKWDDELVEFMPAPFAVFVQILLWYLAASLLSLPLEPINVRLVIFHGLQVALAASVTWMFMRFIDVAANVLTRLSAKTESRLDDQLIPLFRKTLKLVIVLTAAIMIIQNLGYSVTSMIAGLGVGGLAIALAAKDTVSNVFGSIVIFADQPFQVGDWVEFSSIEGTVEEVGFRTTRVRRFDKSQVTVPNAIFSSSPIINHSRRQIRRIKIIVGLSYEANSKQIRQVLGRIRELIKNHPDIDQGFNFVYLVKFADSSLNIQIYCFTKSTVWTEFLAAREDVLLKIMDIVEEHSLELSYPTRTVYLRDENWVEMQPKDA